MRAYGAFTLLSLVATRTYAASLRVISTTTLGQDPHTVNHLNGESYQQDPLVTFNGEPYCTCSGQDAR